MKYGYCRVSTKGQLDGNSIEEQTTAIKNVYADTEIIVESYSGAKERPLFNQLLDKTQNGASCIIQIQGISRKKVEKKIPQSKIRLLTLDGQ